MFYHPLLRAPPSALVQYEKCHRMPPYRPPPHIWISVYSARHEKTHSQRGDLVQLRCKLPDNLHALRRLPSPVFGAEGCGAVVHGKYSGAMESAALFVALVGGGFPRFDGWSLLLFFLVLRGRRVTCCRGLVYRKGEAYATPCIFSRFGLDTFFAVDACSRSLRYGCLCTTPASFCFVEGTRRWRGSSEVCCVATSASFVSNVSQNTSVGIDIGLTYTRRRRSAPIICSSAGMQEKHHPRGKQPAEHRGIE